MRRFAAPLGRDDVGDDRIRERRRRSAERAGHDAREHERAEACRECARERADGEARHGDAERLPSIEAIEALGLGEKAKTPMKNPLDAGADDLLKDLK